MNRWKIAFFSLLTFVVGVMLLGLFFLFGKSSPYDEEFEVPLMSGETIFALETSKGQLNHLLQSQLDTLKYNRDHLDFVVKLDDVVHVNGYLSIFNRKLDFQMQMEPQVQENGNVILQQQSFYIGALPIPSRHVLTFIRSSANLPKWVEIDPQEGVIHLALNKIEVGQNLRVKVDTLDLLRDDISFEIYEP